MKPLQKRTILLFIIILLVAIGIRLAGSANHAIWYDEAFSLLISKAGLAGTLNPGSGSASADVHPPAYYFLLWGWIQVFGSSVISARLLSMLAGVGTIILLFILARNLFNDTVALASAFVAAILPFQVHYSVEIRMYSLLAFWLTLAVLSFWKGEKTGKIYWWVIFAVASALAQYTHNLAAFFLIPLALTGVLQRDWKTARRTLLAGLGAILLYIPWLIHVPAQFAKIQQNYWVERPTVASLVNLVLTYITNLPLPDNLLIPGLAISLVCITIAAFQTINAARKRLPNYKIGLWLAYLSFAPALLLWLFSQWRPVYIERALLPSHVMFCIWFAWALLQTSLPKVVRSLLIGLALAGAGMGLFEHMTYKSFPYAPYEALTQTLSEKVQPGDIILHSNKLSYLPVLYYGPSLNQSFIIDEPGSKSDTLAPATREVLHLNAAEDISSATKNADRIWFIIFQKAIDEYTSAGYSTHAHLQYLNDHFHLISSESWRDILLFQYSREAQ